MTRIEFSKVFELPQGLLPLREVDHVITLLCRVHPINLRAYYYSHVQKEKIERLVNKLLQVALIRPSHSPFSAQYY